MSVCDVSLVLGSTLVSCPKECPFWSQNAVWKNVGVCTAADRCNIYNPVLNYADDASNYCLPCEVYGCVSCTYSDEAALLAAEARDSNIVLPDLCLQCAPGYRMSDDGSACYLVNSSIWSRLFYAVVASLVMAIAALALHLYLHPDKLKHNHQKYIELMEAQYARAASLNIMGGFYQRFRDFLDMDVFGVGSMLYFRFTMFVLAVCGILLVVSIAQSHIPCSDMVRDFSAPFRIDRPSNIANYSSIGSWFGSKESTTLRDRFLNFKYVDDAIDWSVAQYAKDTVMVMRVLYICVMALTIGFLVSQRAFLRSYFKRNTRVQNFTLILSRVPPLHSLEEFIENATSVRPISVAVAYDLQNVNKGVQEFLDLQDDGDHVYVNLEMAAEHNRILNSLQPTGIAFAVFSTVKDLELARHSLSTSGICDANYCEVEPEDVIWKNVGKKCNLPLRIAGVTALSCAIQLIWTFLFFMPYAACRLHSDSGDIFEEIWLTLFVTTGSAMVCHTLRKAADYIYFVSRESLESYLMTISFVTHCFNMGLCVILAHFVNYGGRFKVLSVVTDFSRYMSTPTFKVGEEVSMSLSLNGYMLNTLLLIPALLFLFMYYGTPLITAFLVLTADLSEKQAAQILSRPRFDFSRRYSEIIVNFTCSLLLHFIIRSRIQALAISVSLLAGFVLYYVMDTYILQHKAERIKVNGYAVFYNALLLWSIPTGILAACPSYWRWRAQEGRQITPFIMFFVHVIFYSAFLHVIYNCRRRFGRTEVNNSEANYTMSNPVYKLRRVSTHT